MNGLNWENLLVENILTDIPFSIIYVLFAFIPCGLKNRLNLKLITVYSLVQAIISLILTILLQKYGAQPLPYIISSTILMIYLVKIDFFSALLSSTIAMISNFIIQLLCFSGLSFALGIKFNDFIMMIESSYVNKIFYTYIYLILAVLILLAINKKGIIFININSIKLFSSIKNVNSHELIDNIKVIVNVLLPLSLFLFTNFAIHYYETYNKTDVSSLPYLFFNSLALIVACISMFYLIKRIIKLTYEKTEWRAQKQYLHDVNELLKGLRAQKHGFINHMNVIHGLLSLEEFDEAKKYISDIHQAISTNYNIVSVDNPSLNALINAKLKTAESKQIKIAVTVDDNLSEMNFKSFEIAEAIGNIIDNALEATLVMPNEERQVKIIIYSDNNFYIFDIQNSGITIPADILSCIFDEGFTTKNYNQKEHGFGLHISKKLIEYHQGKIEVESKNNWTSFKVLLPKVIQNEFRAS